MKYLIVVFLISINHAAIAQNFYERIFYNQHGTACAREDASGNIIVAFPEDSTIAKYDSLQNLIWSKTNDLHTYLFEILGNGNWITGGYKISNGLKNLNFAMLDSMGDTLWTRMPIISTANSQFFASDLKIDGKGKYVFMISRDDQNISPHGLIKYDSTGLACGSLQAYGNDFTYNIVAQDHIVTAATMWNPIGIPPFVINAYDSAFSQLWSTTLIDTIGNPHTHRPDLVFSSPYLSTIVSGWWDWYYSLFYFDQNGNLTYTNMCYDYGDLLNSIDVSAGGYLCTGKLYNGKGYALRLGSGTIQNWYIEFDGINGVTPLFMQEVSDGFIISGTTKDLSSNDIPWMTKIDFNGSITTSVPPISSNVQFDVKYANHEIEVRQQTGGDKLIISDLLGKEIKMINNLKDVFAFDFYEKPGIYICTLFRSNGETVGSRKLVIY